MLYFSLVYWEVSFMRESYLQTLCNIQYIQNNNQLFRTFCNHWNSKLYFVVCDNWSWTVILYKFLTQHQDTGKTKRKDKITLPYSMFRNSSKILAMKQLCFQNSYKWSVLLSEWGIMLRIKHLQCRKSSA